MKKKISDHLQGDISSDYSPNKIPLMKSVSPPLTQRSASQHRSQPTTSKLAKYQTPRYPEEVALRQQSKPTLQRCSISYTDQMADDKKIENNITGKQLPQSIHSNVTYQSV